MDRKILNQKIFFTVHAQKGRHVAYQREEIITLYRLAKKLLL